MPVLTENEQRKSGLLPRALCFVAVALLLLLLGFGLLPLANRTFSFGSRGWVTFVVAPENGPGRGAEIFHVPDAYGVRGRTFIGFRIGTWYWMGAFRTR